MKKSLYFYHIVSRVELRYTGEVFQSGTGIVKTLRITLKKYHLLSSQEEKKDIPTRLSQQSMSMATNPDNIPTG